MFWCYFLFVGSCVIVMYQGKLYVLWCWDWSFVVCLGQIGFEQFGYDIFYFVVLLCCVDFDSVYQFIRQVECGFYLFSILFLCFYGWVMSGFWFCLEFVLCCVNFGCFRWVCQFQLCCMFLIMCGLFRVDGFNVWGWMLLENMVVVLSICWFRKCSVGVVFGIVGVGVMFVRCVRVNFQLLKVGMCMWQGVMVYLVDWIVEMMCQNVVGVEYGLFVCMIMSLLGVSVWVVSVQNLVEYS